MRGEGPRSAPDEIQEAFATLREVPHHERHHAEGSQQRLRWAHRAPGRAIEVAVRLAQRIAVLARDFARARSHHVAAPRDRVLVLKAVAHGLVFQQGVLLVHGVRTCIFTKHT